jgi:murein DD-endopeptidase MepM/ murein hydrolase activator NlpD
LEGGKAMRSKIIKWGGWVFKVLLIGSIIIRIILLAFDPIDAVAASPPWTITSEYGEVSPLHPKGHKGLDFAVPMNTPITSITDGTVEVVKDEGNVSFGKSVRIRTDDGKLLIYAHLNEWNVKVGDKVKFGQEIARSGTSGHSTGPHLHFQVNINGKPVDPEPIIMDAITRMTGDTKEVLSRP